MRDTVDAVIIMPVSGAARNAIITQLSYYLLGDLPFRNLAALGVVVFTLFPLTYAWVVCLPWVLVCILFLGRWMSGMALLIVMVAMLSGHSERELQLQEQAGIGDYVHAFSLVLGVYVFGLQGVLFGPMLVCVAKLLFNMASELIRNTEGRIASPAFPDHPAHYSHNSSSCDGVDAANGGSVSDPPDPPMHEPRGGGGLRRDAHRGLGRDGAWPGRLPRDGMAIGDGRAMDGALRDERAVMWSRDLSRSTRGGLGTVLGTAASTMRRLSFFSSPGGSPAYLSAHRRRGAGHVGSSLKTGECESGGVSRQGVVPPCSSKPLSYLPAAAADGLPSAATEAGCSPLGTVCQSALGVPIRVTISVQPWGATNAVGDLPAEEPLASCVRVRVSAPISIPWPDFVLRVEARLRFVGQLSPQQFVRALRSRADGAQVVSAEDLRQDEELEAEVGELVAGACDVVTDAEQGVNAVFGVLEHRPCTPPTDWSRGNLQGQTTSLPASPANIEPQPSL